MSGIAARGMSVWPIGLFMAGAVIVVVLVVVIVSQ